MSQSSIDSLSERNITQQVKPTVQSKRNWQSDIRKLPLFSIALNLVIKTWKLIYVICSCAFRLVFPQQPQKPKHHEFNQRYYQKPVDSLGLKQQQLGFTNQVLCQQSSKSITLYLPVYITCKIKSIQEVSVQNLNGNISCALIVNVGYGDIPDPIIKKLQNSIIVQLNRGQALKLQDDGISITTKNDKKAKFLIFTVRKIFTAFLVEDTLWSPFELIQLIISFTLNTVTVKVGELKQLAKQYEEATGYDQKKQYKISFNCMRNSDKIPLSYSLDCVFGVYDLAERRLQAYHSQVGSYSQIVRAYESQRQNPQPKKKQKKAQAAATPQQSKQQTKQSKDIKLLDSTKNLAIGIVQYSRSLIMRKNQKGSSKPPKKVKYFQYTHFVIPLYKYPGNSLATIFIPIFLLALVSLAIFFQGPELSGRIGTIATMILGYIALIPSIKQQLPPSSKITIVETVVYIETMCCLLCLYESFRIRGFEVSEFMFIWYQNVVFMICLITHILTFLFVMGLFAFHKLKWEPAYNCDQKVIQIKPADNITGWDNPYCDKVFAKFNKQVLNNTELSQKQKRQAEVKIYKNPFKKQVKKQDKTKSENPNNKEESLAKVQVCQATKIQIKKQKSPQDIVLTDFPNVDQFAYEPNLLNYQITNISKPQSKSQ